MKEGTVRYDQLSVTCEEIYKIMGYGTVLPEEDIREIVEVALQEVALLMIGRFSYVFVDGILARNSLRINQTNLKIGPIIANQLNNSTKFVLFAVTAGKEFEAYMQHATLSDDIMQQFVANSIGSCLAEKVADYMEQLLAKEIAPLRFNHTNRFSPGYCDWHVSEQQKLFSLFPDPSPCGIQLTPSSLMMPIKSISGIIGIGTDVKRMEYTCRICTFDICYKKRSR